MQMIFRVLPPHYDEQDSTFPLGDLNELSNVVEANGTEEEEGEDECQDEDTNGEHPRVVKGEEGSSRWLFFFSILLNFEFIF